MPAVYPVGSVHLVHKVDLVDDGSVAYLLVRLVARAEDVQQRQPLNLALAIDRSSSMRGPRIAQAIAAASQVVDKLDGRDRLTVISFDASARVVFGPAQVTDEIKPRLVAALRGLRTGVGTNLAAGIKKGAEAIKTGFVRKAISRLVLLTDGQPSVGIVDADKLCGLVEAQYAAGVTTTAMGIGEGFEDELLAEMARRGRGGFHYLAQAENIPAAFGRELAGLFAIAATGAEIKLVPDADITSVELLHRLPSRPVDDGLEVEIGEVAADAPRQVLFRLGRFAPSGGRRLGTLRCTFRNADGTAGDPHIAGVELPALVPRDDHIDITTERIRIEVAAAVDAAWARRASGDSLHALAALAEVRREVEQARDLGDILSGEARALVDDMTAAEDAIAHSAAEREKIRRGLKERSQITLLGRSAVRRLPTRDDD